MSDTPAVSLREARQREAEMLDVLVILRPTAEELTRRRRATDEALVRAVVEWIAKAPWPSLKNLRFGQRNCDWSAVLDAVEKASEE